jgi:hypothetical protein
LRIFWIILKPFFFAAALPASTGKETFTKNLMRFPPAISIEVREYYPITWFGSSLALLHAVASGLLYHHATLLRRMAFWVGARDGQRVN